VVEPDHGTGPDRIRRETLLREATRSRRKIGLSAMPAAERPYGAEGRRSIGDGERHGTAGALAVGVPL
jgi:hypothetical protein